MLTSYQAAWVFPVSRPPIRGGVVTTQHGRVVEVGAVPASGARRIDLGAVALLPKFINAHTHLEFSDLRAPLGSRRSSFAAWIDSVLAQRASRTEDNAKPAAIALGVQEMKVAGTAAVGEIATLPTRGDAYAALQLDGVVFHELLSTDLDRGRSRLAEIEAIADAWSCETTMSLGLSPHAPYTMHWGLVQQAVEVAKRRHWPVAMHLGESLEELELMASHSGPLHRLLSDRGVWNPGGLPRGIGLADYLRVLAGAPRALAIHGNFFGDAEFELLAKHRDHMSLVVCPRTCDYFLPSLPPIAELIAKGVRVAIGTDSRATNPDLSVWNEAKFLAQASTGLKPSEILHLVTQASAFALGLSDARQSSQGEIAVGGSFENLATMELTEAFESAEAALESCLAAEADAVPVGLAKVVAGA